MKMKAKNTIRSRLECAIALTLFFVLCYAAFCDQAQNDLSEDILRLRVVAHSDSEEDQAVKLRVRDRVLEVMQPLTQRADSREDAQMLLREHMQEIANAAQREVYRSGHKEHVTACLAHEWYPTRDYAEFALPAGEYEGLQIRIGNAAGHNWWCVLYPSLCMDAAGGEEMLTEEESGFIHREGASYQVRFRTAELLGNLRSVWK